MSGHFRYQNVFRVGKKDATCTAAQSQVRKRKRQSVSCLACRSRKSVSPKNGRAIRVSNPYRLKCDRELPYLACSKRGDAALCRYVNGNYQGSGAHDGGLRVSEAQLRLQNLEEMVTTLMKRAQDGVTGRNEESSPKSAPNDMISSWTSANNSLQGIEMSSNGRLDVNGSRATYLGATHWETVLQNVGDICGQT